MAVYIALLRGINVGGTGILPMKDLAAMCAKLGFAKARTYIQSGNVIFESGLKEDAVRHKLEEALHARMGKRIDVMIRTSAELRATLDANPFPEQEPNKVNVAFLAGKPPVEQLRGLAGPAGEQVRAGGREVYVYYPEGMGRSKLKLPLNGAAATVRNINTVSKLTALAQG
ncbi:MAG TPA: DUF1697 domain-containing protein [Bryobacteraceae bacterium]|nr:DUF1697 domain-containing protein [Bryobacteraceae bacterium]